MLIQAYAANFIGQRKEREARPGQVIFDSIYLIASQVSAFAHHGGLYNFPKWEEYYKAYIMETPVPPMPRLAYALTDGAAECDKMQDGPEALLRVPILAAFAPDADTAQTWAAWDCALTHAAQETIDASRAAAYYVYTAVNSGLQSFAVNQKTRAFAQREHLHPDVINALEVPLDDMNMSSSGFLSRALYVMRRYTTFSEVMEAVLAMPDAKTSDFFTFIGLLMGAFRWGVPRPLSVQMLSCRPSTIPRKYWLCVCWSMYETGQKLRIYNTTRIRNKKLDKNLERE